MAIIVGSAAGELLFGTEGDDTIDAGGGADNIDGAGGFDTLLIPGSSSVYRVTTLLGVTHLIGHKDANVNYAGFDSRLINVEQIQFRNTTVALETTSLEVLLGTTATEILNGSDGDDVIDHGGGADRIDGGNGFDTVLFFDNVNNYRITNTHGIIKVLGLGSATTSRAELPYAGFEVVMTNVESLLFRDKRITFGSDRDDILQTWAGKDQVDGGGGIDTVVFSGAESAYTVTRTKTGFTVNGASGDTNTLTNVERFEFADLTLAFDVYQGSPLYNTVLMGAAAAGRAFIDDPNNLGGALRFAAPYNDMQSLAEAVMDLGIYDSLGNRAFVEQLYRNVQHAPTAQEIDTFAFGLDWGLDRSQVLRVFAEGDYNEQSVNLVGLQQTGIEFI